MNQLSRIARVDTSQTSVILQNQRSKCQAAEAWPFSQALRLGKLTMPSEFSEVIPFTGTKAKGGMCFAWNFCIFSENSSVSNGECFGVPICVIFFSANACLHHPSSVSANTQKSNISGNSMMKYSSWKDLGVVLGFLATSTTADASKGVAPFPASQPGASGLLPGRAAAVTSHQHRWYVNCNITRVTNTLRKMMDNHMDNRRKFRS